MTGKTLVFHIGDRKTGSTSIQQAFARNKVTLQDGTIFYPVKRGDNYLKSSFKAYAKPKQKLAHKRAIDSFQKLAQMIARTDADISLISTEAIEGVNPKVFHDIVTRYFADTVDEIRRSE